MPHIDPNTPGGIQPNIPSASGYNIVFSDEFASTPLDNKWRIFKDYGDNSGASNWDLNNGGNSLLRIWPDSSTNYNRWTMDSSGANPYKGFFGVYECRLKQCRGRGMFPSFWMADAALTQPLKPEIDVYECYGYDGGGWNNGSGNGWRPTNAAWTIWYNGAGNSGQTGTLKLTDSNSCTSPFASLDLSAAQHIFTCRIAPGGLTMYFDGVQWGCTTGLPWTQAEIDANPINVILDLWWRLAGLPDPNTSDTPSGPSNSMECDYIRVWSLPGAGSAGPTFNATLSVGPPDSATLQNNVQFTVAGNLIKNVELVASASAATATYGIFTVAANFESANLNLNTNALSNGTYRMRALAYNVPAGSIGSVLTAMEARTYIISNVTSSTMPVIACMDMSF